MPPWPEWQIEYIGTRFLGKLLGLWSIFLVSIFRMLFRSFAGVTKGLDRVLKGSPTHNRNRKNGPVPKFTTVKKLYKLIVVSLLMVSFWRMATLKSIWSSTDEQVHRAIVAFLFLLTACWLITVIWICLSKSQIRAAERRFPYSRVSRRLNQS